LAALHVERKGHEKKVFRIKDTAFFKKPLEVKLNQLGLSDEVFGFSAEMEAPANRKGTKADFHVYIPESVEKVKAAFYISRHGMGDITKPVLKKFAEEENLALIGMFGDPVQRGVDDVANLDVYIEKLAEMSGHPELVDAPIMTFGHSNGTGFAASYPRDRPERVIAWVGFHPGFNNYISFENTDQVPAMIMCGEKDKYLLNARQDQEVAKLRKSRNAAMNIMMEGGVGHGPADADTTWTFITEFLKAAMRTRLNEDGTLKPVEIENGWLGGQYELEKGGRQELEISPYAIYSGDPSSASWLPDEEFAQAWQKFGKQPAK
ncbi:hypothetical protein OAB00_04445, partial [Akkermansiaceae bacterium]|nr:hypothetical protein [Akkermansiaceae bacterium]